MELTPTLILNLALLIVPPVALVLAFRQWLARHIRWVVALTALCDALGQSNNNQLVFDTFDRAVRANPSAHPLFHSDRGYQYTNRQFKAKLDGIHATQSMSRPGRCIDNGPMEGFWGILKSEMYYLQQFHTFEELKKAIDELQYKAASS